MNMGAHRQLQVLYLMQTVFAFFAAICICTSSALYNILAACCMQGSPIETPAVIQRRGCPCANRLVTDCALR